MVNAPIRQCPGCSGVKAKFVGAKNGYEIFVCSVCDSLFTSRLPGPGEMQDYDDYYTEANLTAPAFVVRRVEEILRGFERYRKTGRLLDIGFGAGTILEAASRAGWKPSGQEVSATAADRARQKGYDIYLGELSDAGHSDDSFDVVTCSEILEHVPDPRRLLKEVARILRPGGLLWATTPSANGLSFRLTGAEWSNVAPPEHTQLYSVKGLTRMLGEAGFTKVKIKTHGTNPDEIVRYYIRKLKKRSASDAAASMTPCDINEKLSRNWQRQMLKVVVNGGLNFLRLGDSLKVFAEK